MIWVRKNLFSTPLNALFTVLSLTLIALMVPPALDWAVFEATWSGSNRQACAGRDGACWVFVKARFGTFMYGFYPDPERWRVDLAAIVGVALAAALIVPGTPRKGLIATAFVVVYPVLTYFLLLGGIFGLVPVETAKWGGLMLTLVVAAVGMAGSLPVGILLALGRRSSMPVVRGLCIAFIELWRGVPLITVLFMASVMLPLFLPGATDLDKLARALIGVTLFTGAYMAEVIRGGLQAVPRGQYEAAAALGLGYWSMMILIILPQALRAVVPGIVNTFIALLKDTTLVLVIGLLDLLGMIHAALADPNWLGFAAEGYVFAGVVFWVLCFGLSRLSLRIEAKVNADRRR
ncbi:MAG: amino acid ABC transporter permease [Alphaproteobacteria bacterium]|nr:amino acid ABC transporter permease [Alphaproteobacteria bacterium]